MTAYATPEDVALLLGVTFTGDQEASAALALDAATALLNQVIGREWLTAGTVTSEFVRSVGDRIYLKHYPVTSITSLIRSSPDVTTANQTLVANRDYKLWDAGRGLISLGPSWLSCTFLATYIHTESVPADIVDLTARMAAGMIRLTINPDLNGVKRYTLWGGDLSVEFADDAVNPVIPALFKQAIAVRRVPAIA